MARDRSIKLVIQAQVDGAKRALQDTADAAKKVGDEADKASTRSATAAGRMVQSARDNSDAWNTAGATLTAFGAAAALAIGGSVKAAIDWESAWAGVNKTVDGSATQMAALEGELRSMARTLPATHTEIAAVAEAAGQLGVRREDIAGFTKTMIDLGESTNLTADEAATSIAQMANVMGTSTSDVDRLGSALVELGNNGASTERDIMQMATRLSGAGALVGATEADVLALANTMSSLGIEAQLGGGVMSRVLQKINSEVISSGENLSGFADVAGMSAEAFATAWKSDPVAALDAFIQGLAGMQGAGEDTVGILSDLGIKGTENTSVLLRLTGAGDLLTESLRMGADAWSENTALTDEAAKRYETVASKIQIAKNNIYDAAISFGEQFLPAVGAAADGLADFAGGISDMPPLLQAVAGGATLTAAGFGLIGGGLLLAVPRLVETYDAFKRLHEISPRLAGSIGGIARTVGKGGGLALGLIGIATAMEHVKQASWEATPGVEQFTSALLDMEEMGNADSLNDLIANMDIMVRGSNQFGRADQIDTVKDALDRLLDPTFEQKLEDLDKALLLDTSADRSREALSQIDQALANYAQTAEGAERAAKLLDEALAGTGYSAEEVMQFMPAYSEALARLENEQRNAATGADGLGGSIEDAAADAAAAQEAFDGLKSSIQALGSELLGMRGSARGFEEAIDAAAAAAKEHGATLDISTEAGRANQAALDALASSTTEYAAAAIEAGAGAGEVTAIMAAGRDEFVATAQAMGMTKQEAQDLADRLGLIPENVELMFESAGLDGIVTDIDGTIDYAASVKAMIDLGMEPASAVAAVEQLIAETNAKKATATVDADTGPAKSKSNAWSFDTNSMRPVPTVDADTSPAKGKVTSWVWDANAQRPVPKVDADTGPASSAARGWRDWASGLTATAGINASERGAYSVARGIIGAINGMWAWINVGSRYAGGVNSGSASRHLNRAVYTGGVVNRDSGGFVTGYAPHVAGPAYGITDLFRMGLDGRLTHYAESGRGLSREWYLSDHPSYRPQNINYALDALRGLGAGHLLKAYAAGGVAQARFASSTPVYAPPYASSSSSPVVVQSPAGPVELSASSVRAIGKQFASAAEEAERMRRRLDRGGGRNY